MVHGWNRRGDKIFCIHQDRPWDPPSLLYNGHYVSFLQVWQPGRGVDHPPLFNAEVKERVELLYLPKCKMTQSKTTRKNHVCQVKMYLCKSKTTPPPKCKISAKKKYFAVTFIHLLHKACKILCIFTNQCHCLHHALHNHLW